LISLEAQANLGGRHAAIDAGVYNENGWLAGLLFCGELQVNLYMAVFSIHAF